MPSAQVKKMLRDRRKLLEDNKQVRRRERERKRQMKPEASAEITKAERQWAHQHQDVLQRRAERAMAKWKWTLDARARLAIGE